MQIRMATRHHRHDYGLRCICTIICTMIGMNTAASAHAGSWAFAPGEGQIIQTNSHTQALRGFDSNGNLDQLVQFSKYESSLFWEHGLSKTYTFTVSTSYQDLGFRAGVDDVEFHGFGETSVGIRHILKQKGPNVLSMQTTAIFAGPGETVTDADLGTGSTQFEARLLAGHSFKLAHRDGFIDAQAAWRYRTGAAPDEWRLDLTAGLRPIPKLQILAQTFYVESQAVPHIARATKRLKAQASLVFDKSKRTSYQIGVYQTVAGQNIVRENAVFIGIWQRY